MPIDSEVFWLQVPYLRAGSLAVVLSAVCYVPYKRSGWQLALLVLGYTFMNYLSITLLGGASASFRANIPLRLCADSVLIPMYTNTADGNTRTVVTAVLHPALASTVSAMALLAQRRVRSDAKTRQCVQR